MKELKQRKKTLDLEVLRTTVLMVCGGTHKELEKTFARFCGVALDQVPTTGHANADGRTIYGGGFYAMWARFPRPSTIAHEAVHITINLLNDKGIALDEELIAYMVGHIVNKYRKAFANIKT